MSSFLNRTVRAIKLDASLYEEVEADTNALRQAMGMVVLSSLCAGIGSMPTGTTIGILSGTLGALAGWYIWAYLIYVIGTKMLPEPQTSSSHKELLRTIGFSSAPGLVRVFGIIPGLTEIVFLASSMWMLVAMIIAVRQALDYRSTWRAVGVCLIGWVVQVIIILFVFFMFGKVLSS